MRFPECDIKNISTHTVDDANCSYDILFGASAGRGMKARGGWRIHAGQYLVAVTSIPTEWIAGGSGVGRETRCVRL